MTWRPMNASPSARSSSPSGVMCSTGAQNDMRIDGFPDAARRTNRRSECSVRSISPGPERAPSGWVRCITVSNPRSSRPTTWLGVSTTTPSSSWSSPPGIPVPWAVEPTSTSRIVNSGSGGMSIALIFAIFQGRTLVGVAPGPRCCAGQGLKPPRSEVGHELRSSGVESHNVEHARVVGVRDAEPVRHHADDDELRRDARALAVLAKRLGRMQ